MRLRRLLQLLREGQQQLLLLQRLRLVLLRLMLQPWTEWRHVLAVQTLLNQQQQQQQLAAMALQQARLLQACLCRQAQQHQRQRQLLHHQLLACMFQPQQHRRQRQLLVKFLMSHRRKL